MQSHQYGAGTHIGNARENNEDTYVCATDKELWIVADGMGGLGFGEAASAIAAYTVTTLVKQGHGVNQAIAAAHLRVKEFAETEAQGTNMGTTLVLLLSQGNVYNVFWVGDSRGYLFNETLTQLTRDHSLVQSLIDQGVLTEQEAQYDPRRNAITMALGVRELETVRADTVSDRWRPGDKILMCSDGLTDCVADEEIEEILHEEGSDQELVERIIQKALTAGGRDNITVVVVSAPDSISSGDSDTEVPYEEDDERPDETTPKARDNSETRVTGQPLGKKSGPAQRGEMNSTATRVARAANGEPIDTREDPFAQELRETDSATGQSLDENGIFKRFAHAARRWQRRLRSTGEGELG